MFSPGLSLYIFKLEFSTNAEPQTTHEYYKRCLFPESYTSGNQTSTEETAKLIQIGTSPESNEDSTAGNHLQMNHLYKEGFLTSATRGLK